MIQKSGEKTGKDFQSELDRVNEGLDKVKVRKKSDRLYLRAVLPPKAGSGKWQRQEIAVGVKANLTGLNKAKAKAKKLDSDLFLNQFDWGEWLNMERKVCL
ncbi:MAG: hypothetical protein J7647_00665 [Cyanobacteria bacterium SBLK]|nr:hypothetical protein [Cyanobacteria bacterium SBLK]